MLALWHGSANGVLTLFWLYLSVFCVSLWLIMCKLRLFVLSLLVGAQLSVHLYAQPEAVAVNERVASSAVGNLPVFQTLTAGTLPAQFTYEEAHSLAEIAVAGRINACDIRFLRDSMRRLEVLDLREATIASWIGQGGTARGGFSFYLANAMPENAFSYPDQPGLGKQALREVWLPRRVSTIDKQAFAGCDNLRLLICSDPKAPNLFAGALNDSLTVVFVPLGSLGAYKNKRRWENFNILEGIPNRLTLTNIRPGSLSNEILRTGNQPSAIHYLSVSGLLNEDDFNLIRDFMPNLVAIDMRSAQAATLPDYTFAQKHYLTTVILPEGLQRIGARAFSGCSRLSGNLTLPASVQTIGEGAFLDCDRLNWVLITGGRLAEVGGNLFRGNSNKLVFLPTLSD